MHALTLGSSNRALFGQAAESTQSTVNPCHHLLGRPIIWETGLRQSQISKPATVTTCVLSPVMGPLSPSDLKHEARLSWPVYPSPLVLLGHAGQRQPDSTSTQGMESVIRGRLLHSEASPIHSSRNIPSLFSIFCH